MLLRRTPALETLCSPAAQIRAASRRDEIRRASQAGKVVLSAKHNIERRAT